MRNDILFIRPSACEDFIYEGLKKEGFYVEPPFRGNSFLGRAAREISFKLRFIDPVFWYNNRVIDGSFSVVVVFDATVTVEYLQWLRKHYPSSRIILYYLNPITRSLNPDQIDADVCEKWSSDYFDCENYADLHWDDKGFYFGSYRKPKADTLYDVLYIGRNKGRKGQLLELKDMLTKQGLRVFYYIVADRRYQAIGTPMHKRALAYEDIANYNSHARSILCLSKGGQSWLTIRVFESLFNEIKLITDNKMLQDCDFYHPDNIYIIGHDKRGIPDFLDRPYHRIDQALIERYDFSNWVKRMFPSR